MSQLPYKSKKKTKLCDKNSRKCGEITFCLQLDTRVYALRCLFCPQIFIQWDSFISHMEEEHDEELRSDHLLQQEIEEVNVEADISKEKKAHKQASVRLLKELPQSNQMSVRTEFSDGTSIEDLLDICDPLEEIEAEKSTSIKTTAKSNKYCFVPDKSFDTRIVNQSTLDHSYERIEDQMDIGIQSPEYNRNDEQSRERDVSSLMEKLDEMKKRIFQILKEQTQIMQNQSVLSTGQNTIVSNQQEIATKLEIIEAIIVSKPDMMDQSIVVRDCNNSINKVEDSVCRITSETHDKTLDEIASMLPLQTIAVVQEVEQKLATRDYAQAMTTFIYKLKGPSEDIDSVIRAMFTDNLLIKYNWDGRWERHALGKLILFNKILRDVFKFHGALGFQKSVKNAVRRSHHRVKQKMYLKKKANE